jgi:hypothetical protein
MPPPPQKGTGKKGRDRDVRQSRSRNTTPSLTGSSLPPSAGSGSVLASGTTPFLNLPVSSFRTLEDAIENYGSTIPSYRDLEALLNQLNVLADVVDAREEVCDKGMRLMAKERKDRMEEIEGERVIKERERGEEVEREREREREKDRERDRERGKKKGEKGEKRKRRDAEGSGSAARDRDGREERERHGGHAQDGNGKMFGESLLFHCYIERCLQDFCFASFTKDFPSDAVYRSLFICHKRADSSPNSVLLYFHRPLSWSLFVERSL